VKVVERSTPMILLPIDLCGGARRRKSTPLISTGRACRAMRRAIDGLKLAPQHPLIDAKRLKEATIPQQAIIKRDAKSASIAAASILARVSRDALMRTLDECHPGYGFADHKGYPVRAHYVALSRLGACAAHRRSFGPVREVLGLPPLPPWPTP
jgi:ribonuclease HII